MYRKLRFALPFLIGACLAPAAMAAPGDVNANGQVDTDDALRAARFFGGVATPTAAEATAADVAGPAGKFADGKVTLHDVARILRAVGKLDDLGGTSGGTPTWALDLEDTLTLSGNLTKNYKLPGGFQLTGTLKDTQGQSLSRFEFDMETGAYTSTSGSIIFTNAANAQQVYAASAALQTGAYSVRLPAGTYNAYASTQVYNEDNEGNTHQAAFSGVAVAPTSVAVNADKAQAFVRADLPATGTVSGTVTGEDFVPQSLAMVLNAPTGNWQGYIGGSVINYEFEFDSNAYTLTPGPGQGRILLEGIYAPNDAVSVSVLLAAPVTVTSGASVTRKIALPALALVRGTATSPPGAGVESVSITNDVSQSGNVDTFSSDFYSDEASNRLPYQLAVPAGAYTLGVGLETVAHATSELGLTYVTNVNVPAGGLIKDVSLPALPPLFSFSGVVTGPTNQPVANATVSLFPQISGTSVPSGYYASVDGTTNASGQFLLKAPAGKYAVSVSAPN